MAYIEVSLRDVSGSGFNTGSAASLIDRLESGELLSFLETICSFGGNTVPEDVTYLLSRPDKEPHWNKFYTHDIQRTLHICLSIVPEDLRDVLDESKPGITEFHCEYDPATWTEGMDENFSSHVSGRLFALAYVGALQAGGLDASGTNLRPMEPCSIHLTLINKGDGYGFDAATAHIESLSPSDLLAFIEIIYSFSGKNVPEESVEMLAKPDKEPRWTKFYASNLKDTLQSCLEVVAVEDIPDVFDEDKPQINGFHCDYDPADWLKEPRENFSSHVSGRLFALAYVGALQAWGFQVSGTNLPQ